MHANDRDPEPMTQARRVCERRSERAGAGQSRAAYLGRGGEPLRGAAESGPRGLPQRRGMARGSSLRVGKGDASLPLLVSPGVTLPLDEHGGTPRDGTPPARAQVFPDHNNVALELGIMPSQVDALLAVSQGGRLVDAGAGVPHFDDEGSSQSPMWCAFTGRLDD